MQESARKKTALTTIRIKIKGKPLRNLKVLIFSRDVKKNATPLNSINPNQVAGTTHNNSKQSEKNLQSEKSGRGATIAIRAKENSLSPTNSGDHKVVPEEAPLTKSDSSFSSQELAGDNRKADKGGDLCMDSMIIYHKTNCFSR